MVFRQKVVEERLKELDTVLTELSKYREKEPEELRRSPSLRWTIERGLIAAATPVFEMTDHILAACFGTYSETYEDSLRLLFEKGIISAELFGKIKGLGGFRNILVHEYLRIDIAELHRNFQRAFELFPAFSTEIQNWLEEPK